MRFPRGAASSILSLAAGFVAAASVATTWFPVIRYAEQREVETLSRQLRLLAELAADALADQAGPGPVPLGTSEQIQASLLQIPPMSRLEQALVLDPTGAALASLGPGDLAPARVAALCDLPAVLAGQIRSIPPLTDDAGRRLQGACAPVRGEAGQPAAILATFAGADYEERLSEQQRKARMLLLLLGSLSGLVVMLAIRLLLSPIQDISQAAKQIAEGEHSRRVHVRGPEEIAELARAVNALASYLERREDEIGSRMAVVKQLASMVAHEVRNPLQSLSLLCTLARTEPDPQKRDKMLASIEEEITTLEGVVQRFLRSSGPLRITRREADLVQIVEQAANIARPAARKQGVSMLIQAPGSLRAPVDGTLVRRAMENLMLNAIEFAGREPPGQVTVSVLPREKSVLLIVDDDGPGVPRHEKDRVFEQYYSSKPGGTGLGLSLVKRVFDTHGGWVRCEDSPLGGARFVASVPLSAPPDDDKGGGEA